MSLPVIIKKTGAKYICTCVLLWLWAYVIVQIPPHAILSQDKHRAHVRAWELFNETGVMALLNPPSVLLVLYSMLLFICVSWEMYRCSECHSVAIWSQPINTQNPALSFQFCVCVSTGRSLSVSWGLQLFSVLPNCGCSLKLVLITNIAQIAYSEH
jgi:hypothetical protein